MLGEELRVLSPLASGVLNSSDLLWMRLKAMDLGESLAVRDRRVHLFNSKFQTQTKKLKIIHTNF